MPQLLVDDTSLHFKSEGAGPTVFLVQGVGVEGRGWAPQVERLAPNHRTIILDNRGIGLSSGSLADLSVDRMARDVIAVADHLSIRDVHFVGHSLGGVIVQRVALLRPSLARSLSFLCTFAGGNDLQRPSAALIWRGIRSRLGTESMRRRAFASLVMPPAFLRERGVDEAVTALESAFGRSLAAPPVVADQQLRALRAHDERERLAELAAIPSLVMSGKHDIIATPSAGRALASGIGTARFVEWEHAGHALPIQLPDEVTSALREHFESSCA